MDGGIPDTIQTIPEALAHWAERTPAAPAFVTPGQPVIAYDGLYRRALALAASLRRAGIGREDRVALLMPEGAEFAVALLGAMSAAVAIPLGVRLTPRELSAALDRFGAAAALVAPASPPDLVRALTRHGVPVRVVAGRTEFANAVGWGEAGRPDASWLAPRPEDIAMVQVTSGTTGTPKGVRHGHGGLMADGRGRRDLFGLTARDRALAVAPLSLSLGACVLFHTLAAGGSVIFPPALDAPTLWATMVEAGATWMFPAAGMAEVLLRFLRERPDLPPPPALRLVRVTAAPISDAVCEELSQRLGAPVLNSYSATETSLIATALPLPAAHRRGSVGRPILDVRVVDAAGTDVARGAPGQIWVRPPHVFAGYLADAAPLRPDGWYDTGDIGHLDEDGFLFLTGRASELINRGGDKIAPAEVEAVLVAHPAVRAAAAFAVPDARWGEDVAAAVALADGREVSAWELRAWALQRLSPHKAPRHIWFVPELPRTALGKVRRGELQRLWIAGHEAKAVRDDPGAGGVFGA